MPDGQPKVCIHCGQDCSGKPRIKDPQGRYACKACVDARAGQQPAKPAPLPKALAPLLDEDDNPVFDLAEPEAVGLRQSATEPCPACGVVLQPGAVLCTSCGRSTTSGKKVSTHIGAAVDEPKTYSSDPKKAKREREREAADAATTRNQYIVPIVLFLVGGGVVAGIGLSGKGATAEEASAYFGIMMVILAAYSIMSTAAYLLCCMLWMGLNTSLHIVVLQILGITACSWAVEVVLFKVVLGALVATIVGTFTFAGLMVRVMDLDFQDSILASVICYTVTSFVAGWFIVPLVVAMFV